MREVTCADVRDAAAEFALDILEPLERSTVAAHLLRCPECRAEVEGMQESARRLLDLVPGTEPPVGFDHRVLERVGVPISPARRRFRLVAVMAAAVLIILGSTFGAVVEHGGHSSHPALASAPFVAQGRTVGLVNVYGGPSPWIEMSVKDLNARGRVTCELVTSGGLVSLGSFDLVNGAAYWGASERSGFTGVSGVRIVDSNGKVLASAAFA